MDENKKVKMVNLDSFAIIKEAYELSTGLISLVVTRTVFATLAIFVMSFALSLVAMMIGLSTSSRLISFIISIINLTLFAYIMSPVILACIRHAAGLPFTAEQVTASCKKVGEELLRCILLFAIIIQMTYAITSILMESIMLAQNSNLYAAAFAFTLYIVIGIIPFIITSALYIFAIPVVVIRDFDYQEAANEAYDQMKLYWVQILVCLGVYSILSLLIALPFIIAAGMGIFLAMPALILFAILGMIPAVYLLAMYYLICAIIFRNVYHV